MITTEDIAQHIKEFGYSDLKQKIRKHLKTYPTKKVVISDWYELFNLSQNAIKFLQNSEEFLRSNEAKRFYKHNSDDLNPVDRIDWKSLRTNISREDPFLIQYVEELMEGASYNIDHLAFIDIPEVVNDYELVDHDGLEYIDY